METADFFESIRQHLAQPEYIHVLLNPLPIYGLGLGVLALIIAMILGSRGAQITALILILLTALAAWPVTFWGDRAYDAMEPQIERAGYRWLDAHGQRALRAMPLYYAIAALAALALVVPWKFPKAARLLCAVVVISALAGLAAGAWIGAAGGPIRHKEFRRGTPTEPEGGYEKMR